MEYRYLRLCPFKAIKLGWRKVSSLVLVCFCVAVATFHLTRNKTPSPWLRSDISVFNSKTNRTFENFESVKNAKVNISWRSGSTSPSKKVNYMPAINRGKYIPAVNRGLNTVWTGKGQYPYYPQDLMTVGPFSFLQDYKNPCFKTTRASIACLPYFYLAGAPKSGTTDLAVRIKMHPEVTQDVQKEPHWITRRRFRFNNLRKRYPRIEEYLSIFSRATLSIRRDVKSFYHPTIVGDCSASTLWDNYYWPMLKENRNRSEPLHTVPDYIHHMNPNTKIIVILRNPTERLYSDYLYFTKFNKTPQNFHIAVKETVRDYQECFRRYTVRQCLLRSPRKGVIRIYIGLYYYHIVDYLRVFPRSQILVLKMEDYSENMSQNLKKVFSFLDIAPLNKTQMATVANQTSVRNSRRSRDRTQGDMLPETRQILNDFYKPHNIKLENLLGTKFWD